MESTQYAPFRTDDVKRANDIANHCTAYSLLLAVASFVKHLRVNLRQHYFHDVRYVECYRHPLDPFTVGPLDCAREGTGGVASAL